MAKDVEKTYSGVKYVEVCVCICVWMRLNRDVSLHAHRVLGWERNWILVNLTLGDHLLRIQVPPRLQPAPPCQPGAAVEEGGGCGEWRCEGGGRRRGGGEQGRERGSGRRRRRRTEGMSVWTGGL